MARLIDADKLPKYTGYALSASEVAIAVENAPTVDAVLVCRCRDCKHSSEGIYGMMYCKFDTRERRADWFCADGERKGGDE